MEQPQGGSVKRIMSADPNMIYLQNDEIFNPDNNPNIYDDPGKNSYIKWNLYLKSLNKGGKIADNTVKLLSLKYVDVDEDNKDNKDKKDKTVVRGGRSSNKKYKKSSKRGRSMKRNVSSKSRKYSRRK